MTLLSLPCVLDVHVCGCVAVFVHGYSGAWVHLGMGGCDMHVHVHVHVCLCVPLHAGVCM